MTFIACYFFPGDRNAAHGGEGGSPWFHRAVSGCPNPHNDMRNGVHMTRSLNLCKKISETGKRPGSQLLIAVSTAHLPRLSADTSPEEAQSGPYGRWRLQEQGTGWPLLLH